MKRKISIDQSYEPLVTPSGWKDDELRFSVRLTQILDSVFARLRSLHTGKLGKMEPAADSALLNGKTPEYYLPHFNHLDNSAFSVNQRGMQSYTGKAGAYTLDRWAASTAAVKIVPNETGVQIDNRASASANGHMTQRIDGMADGSYTFCASTSSGMILRVFTLSAGKLTTNAYTNTGAAFTAAGYSNGRLTVQLGVQAGKEVTFLWAALYAGKYTVQTLPPYAAKGYVQELLSCMRYYQLNSTGDIPACDLRPPMAASPHTVTQLEDGTWSYSCDL